MNLKHFLQVICISIFFFSCSEDNDITVPRNLQEYIAANASRELDTVLAFGANADANLGLSYIFYYPTEGATEIKYFETDSTSVNETDFSNYKREILSETDVFGGKLKRFSRSSSEEAWCVVTYFTAGKLHTSQPIRLKNATNPTTWEEEVTIEYPTTLEPKFTWSDFGIIDNDIYFQVLTDEEDAFISGIYTRDNFFQYYDTSNTDQNLVINTTPPPALVVGNTYNFTLMAISKDNWVNLVIQNSFVAQ
jgi:hypothetical protein